MIGQSGSSNDTNDQQEMTGLAVRMEQSVDDDTGAVTLSEREREEGDDIENQLVQHVTNHAASIVVSETACDGHVNV